MMTHTIEWVEIGQPDARSRQRAGAGAAVVSGVGARASAFKRASVRASVRA